MSWYITIRSDNTYSQFIEIAEISAYLTHTLGLGQTSPLSFFTKPEMLPCQVIIAKCNSSGNYNNNDLTILHINVIELICPYTDNELWYDLLASKIASFLNWKAFEDMEERRIWPTV
jgi:hypothetical protein